MSVIKINVSNVLNSGSSASSAKTIISSSKNNIRSVCNQIDVRIKNSNDINNRINKIYSTLNQAETRTARLKSVVDMCAVEYRNADAKVKKLADKTAAFPDVGSSGKGKPTDSLLKKILKDQWKIEGAVIGGSVTGNGSLFGINTSGTAEGDLIGGSVKTKSDVKWDIEKGNVGAGKSIEAEGHLAKGKLKGNIGLLGGEIGGTVGSVGATGKIGVTLFKDGKLSPTIDAKAKAEAAVAKGNASVTIGNDKNNAHVKGSGTLLGAEAEASGSAGIIKSVDPVTNETKTEFGVKGKVGAEAYLAQGKVSGGISILGVKIDASVSGKAGGVGVNAGGKVTTGGISGEIGAGLGLGAGIGISIDWSGLFS